MLVRIPGKVNFSTEKEDSESFFRKYILNEQFEIKTIDYLYSLVIKQISQIDICGSNFIFEARMIKAQAINTHLSSHLDIDCICYFNSKGKVGWIISKKKRLEIRNLS